MWYTQELQELTVRSPRLYCLPILVGVPHKVGVSPRPALHAPGIQAHSSLLVKLLKVLGVQGVFDSGLMWRLSAVKVVPVNAIKEGMALQKHNLAYLSCNATAYSVIACPLACIHVLWTCHCLCCGRVITCRALPALQATSQPHCLMLLVFAYSSRPMNGGVKVMFIATYIVPIAPSCWELLQHLELLNAV